jgi:hypothetical protein
MRAKRMNREEFFAKLAPLDEDRLRKALWNLYWRGSAAMRERIESELDPAEQERRRRAAAEPPQAGSPATGPWTAPTARSSKHAWPATSARSSEGARFLRVRWAVHPVC